MLKSSVMNKSHVAFMKKFWGLTGKILSGEKKIESRWYLHKSRPWNKIKAGDTIYFKDSGSLIKIRAKGVRVLQFENLTPDKVSEILKTYGFDIGIPSEEINDYFQLFKDKKYCILVFLKDVESVEPFDIDKKGFGSMSAWITVDDIEKIKKEVKSFLP